MQLAALTSVSGHAVFLLLVQLALLLLVARLGAVILRAMGLPALLGELAAGIVLGPSVLGHYFPTAFAVVFPPDLAQFHLLDVVGQLGMVLLLLLTGLETDLRLLKNLGRAALVASAMGMVVPFAFGFGLGEWMPEGYLAKPDQRTLFAAFLATTMAISAMPVIAKILMDLDLMRRNIGLVILSAGVVDDTVGWLILSVIAGAAKYGSVRIAGLGMTLAYLALFLIVLVFVIYPLMRLLMRLAVTRLNTPHTDLVLIIALTFLGAAVTEKIGVHAVFGAFVVGAMLRQVPQLRTETVQQLEAFVFSILAPIFFGIVGLRVDLWAMDGGGYMLGLVLAIACLGKLLGCGIGGLWGGMRFWEALSIAVAMNARGAMGLVVASIGLSLEILTQQVFSMIVVMAVATSFMAPLGLRLTMRMVRMSDEEAQRLRREASRGAFDAHKVRMLVPTAAGPNALEAARIAQRIAKRSENSLEVLFVDAKSTSLERALRWFRKDPAGSGLSTHLQTLQSLVEGAPPPRIRHVASRSVSNAIITEAQKGIDVLMIGASGRGSMLGGRILEEVVVGAPCHVVIVKAGSSTTHRHVFVPIDGSAASRIAAEFALIYAEAAGAELTVGFIHERRVLEDSADVVWTAEASTARRSVLHERSTWAGPAAKVADPGTSAERPAPVLPLTPEEELERVSPAFGAAEIRTRLIRVDYDPGRSTLAAEILKGDYDLVVLGAENRAVTHRMFFGYESQRIVEQVHITTLIVVPKFSLLRDRRSTSSG